MGKTTTSGIFSGSFWGIIAKILDALAKFITIPMLVGYYGKADYGLIALAFSLNAYLRLMDLGMNIGSIRFFSMWIVQEEWQKIEKVSRSSIVFYGTIGIINAIIFIILSDHGVSFFNITEEQIPVFKGIMYILAFSTVLNWTSNVITQLLSAYGELAWINKATIISSILNFATAFTAIYFKLDLTIYFCLYTISTLIIIPLNIHRLKVFNLPLRELITPKWDGRAFKEILGYSLAIFVMGIFQITANNLRPILLAKYASGIAVLTDYRVIQTIAMLVMAIGGVFMQVLLPSASKIYAENDKVKMSRMVYDGTKYISVLLTFIVFILIANSDVILTLYMGEGYQYLSIWLSIWLLTVLLSMHNAPVASLVLSTGKTKFLVYSSAIACILSLPVTVIFAAEYEVGAAVIGYLIFVVIQISFYYIYYTPKVLHLDSAKLFFKSFLPSVLCAVLAGVVTYLVNRALFFNGSNIVLLLIRSCTFSLSFITLILLFVIKPKELIQLKKQYIRK